LSDNACYFRLVNSQMEQAGHLPFEQALQQSYVHRSNSTPEH